MAVNCDRRIASTVAPQSLMLMNGDFALKQAQKLATRIRVDSVPDYDRELVASYEERFPLRQAAWQYGYGNVEEPATSSTNPVVVHFQPLPHWTGSAWQGGATLPDPTTGWAILHAAGGHPGDDAQRAVIRRWVASQPGSIAVSGSLKHLSKSGDGVRGRLVSNRQGLLGSWNAKDNAVETHVAKIEVQRGEILDFVTDCLENVTSDSFEWSLKLRMSNEMGLETGNWDSSANFHGPVTRSIPQQIALAWRLAYCRPITIDELDVTCQFVDLQMNSLKQSPSIGDPELTAMQSLCQQILSSNEFLYLD